MSIFPISLAILLLYQKYTSQCSKSSSMIKKSSSYTLNTCQKLVTNLKENVNIFNDFSSEQRQPFSNNSTPFNSNIWRHQQTKHSWYCYLTLLPCFPAAMEQRVASWFHFNQSWVILGSWYQLVLPLCKSSFTVACQVLFGLPLHFFPPCEI